MNYFGKMLVLLTIIVAVFKIEFFPFSNYPMYSDSFIPKENTYTFFEILAIDQNNREAPFINSGYGLFQSRFQLIESYYRHSLNTKQPNYFLSGILNFKNIKYDLKELRVYQINYNWGRYKEVKLSGIPNDSLKIREHLLVEKYP